MNKSTSFQPVGSIISACRQHRVLWHTLTPPVGILHCMGRSDGKRNRQDITGHVLMAHQWQVRLMHNPIREWSLSSSQLPNSQCEAYNQQKYKHQCCSCVDCILQIFLSSYRISLSFNQSFVINIRSISISSPSHFYFVLYCFIDFSCPCICPYESS